MPVDVMPLGTATGAGCTALGVVGKACRDADISVGDGGTLPVAETGGSTESILICKSQD